MTRLIAGLFAAGALYAQTHIELSRAVFPEGRAALSLGNHRISFEFTPIEFSGDRVIFRTLTFSGRTYTFGTRVISDLEAKHLQLGWTYHFHLLNRRIRFGPMVEAHGFLLSGELRAPDLNVDSEEDLSIGLPTVGASLEISPQARFDIYGEASGMGAGDYGHFIRSEAGVRFRPIRFVQLSAGYKTFNLRVAESQDFTRLHLRGPFVGGGFRW